MTLDSCYKRLITVWHLPAVGSHSSCFWILTMIFCCIRATTLQLPGSFQLHWQLATVFLLNSFVTLFNFLPFSSRNTSIFQVCKDNIPPGWGHRKKNQICKRLSCLLVGHQGMLYYMECVFYIYLILTLNCNNKAETSIHFDISVAGSMLQCFVWTIQ